MQPLIMSFRNAIRGMTVMIQSERNAKIHIVSATLVVLCGFAFSICSYEWIAIVFAIGIVFANSALNVPSGAFSNVP